ISMITSTRAVMLLPAYTKHYLPESVTSRPVNGEVPTLDLIIAYDKANNSQILRRRRLRGLRDRQIRGAARGGGRRSRSAASDRARQEVAEDSRGGGRAARRPLARARQSPLRAARRRAARGISADVRDRSGGRQAADRARGRAGPAGPRTHRAVRRRRSRARRKLAGRAGRARRNTTLTEIFRGDDGPRCEMLWRARWFAALTSSSNVVVCSRNA